MNFAFCARNGFQKRVYTINSKDIIFDYRKTNLPKISIIFLSAIFKTVKKKRSEVKENIHRLKEKKEITTFNS